MTLSQISKVWTVVGLFLLYYVLNTWIVTQGGQEIFGAKLVVSYRIPAAMWGIPIACVLIGLNSVVGLHYAGLTGPAWHDRVPVVGFERIDTSSREGKFYQGTMLALLSLLPALALIHFWRLFNNAKVVTTDNPPKPVDSIWDWSALNRSLDDPARICTDYIVDGAKISCEKNATILPGLEPAILATLTLAAVLLLTLHWRAVFGRQRKRTDLLL
jgi:hypothetical protein